MHVCKIFPGGRFSDLIEALDYCVEQRIDVVNLSLASRHHSPLVAAKIDQAREAGVACVVAAGNDGGPVGFPGILPGVLTVAAVGKADAFPPGTAHEAEIRGPVTGDGFFSPRFTCHGPEIDVCAPGVAVLSAVPPDGYAALDGTSMAAPHVAGLAALVLAHHGDFRGPFSGRDARRVDHLFHIIKSSCVPLNLGDLHRTGAGMPNALRALAPALAQITPEPIEAGTLLGQLTAEMTGAGLLVPAAGGPDGEAGHTGQDGQAGPGRSPAWPRRPRTAWAPRPTGRCPAVSSPGAGAGAPRRPAAPRRQRAGAAREAGASAGGRPPTARTPSDPAGAGRLAARRATSRGLPVRPTARRPAGPARPEASRPPWPG